ncbi:glutamate-rich protein 1 [Saccopteryx leptura]|uniref:glutamate-rich protein 1 n=1 Tax=Saccopteryx leptura TaxID=249018 RepID=UPI00339CA74B
MAAVRRHVFVEKVLKRLFPHDPHGQEKRAALPVASEAPPEKVAPEKGPSRCAPPSTGGGTETPPARRLYTVALPPEGYVPAPPEPLSLTDSESAPSSDDVGDQDPHDQPKRRRIRKHKSKKIFKNPNSVHLEQAELEKQQSLLQEKLQPQHTDGPSISKNKKRKLKKRQQTKRKRAAGLLTKASGISFLYEPAEEQGDASEGAAAHAGDAGDGVADAAEEDGGDAEGAAAHAGDGDAEEDGGDAEGAAAHAWHAEEAREDEGEAEGAAAHAWHAEEAREDEGEAEEDSGNDSKAKADGILDFLKSTQEMYFYDGVSKDTDPAFLEATEELFKGLEARSLPLADLLVLDHMKTLLLLQAPERLQRALQVFAEHCSMPPEQANVISTFFNYWLTHVLPEKQ